MNKLELSIGQPKSPLQEQADRAALKAGAGLAEFANRVAELPLDEGEELVDALNVFGDGLLQRSRSLYPGVDHAAAAADITIALIAANLFLQEGQNLAGAPKVIEELIRRGYGSQMRLMLPPGTPR